MESKASGIIRAVMASTGRDIAPFDPSFLEVTAGKRINKLALGDSEKYIALLSDDIGEATAFIESLGVTYSEFFRNSLTFSVLDKYVLGAMLSRKGGSKAGEIRIWSAGCAAGQEPYSLAILLADMGLGCSSEPRVRIFATDVSEEQIEMAKSALYDARSLRNVKLGHLNKHFTKVGDRYRLNPSIKQMVEFSVLDLLDERHAFPSSSIYGGFDIITCCNVLYYYSADSQNRILNRLFRALGKGGCIVTDEVEKSIIDRFRRLRPFEWTSPIYCQSAWEDDRT